MWHASKSEFAYFPFYQIKRKICNLDNIDASNYIHHIILHATVAHELCVHIFVLLIKQNICWHHKTINSCDYVARNNVSISQFGHCFKTLDKNMQIGVIKGNIIFVYVNRLNLFLYHLHNTPVFKWNCQTTHRHVLNARCAIIRVREKAAFCNIMTPTGTKLK